MISKIEEGTAKIEIPGNRAGKIHSKMPVFYNPVMQLSRDISIIFLNSISRKSSKPLRCLDLLSASGIRAIRIKKEVPNTEVTANDMSKKAFDRIKKNAKLNNVKLKVKNKEAHVLLSELKSYDFIDIDPFGTPIPFLDAAIKRLSPHSYISVTATDTSALCGTYDYACRRKYSSKPLRNEFMHEIGIRILIYKIQQVAAQYDVALTPVFSHSSNHYMKVYLKKEIGAKKANEILKKHGYVFYNWKTCDRKPSTNLEDKPKNWDYAGPLWLGQLWDLKITNKMLEFAKSKKHFSEKSITLLEKISNEALLLKTIGYFNIHYLSKKHCFGIPKMNFLIENINKKGFKASRTHFSETSLKTTSTLKKLLSTISSLSKQKGC